ncbi:hypothetical protein [Arthrobacter sp. GAS37]|uniref:hypothetical protein n=1 Tax=Arthrobacter sp. GAS37 TaxID=3156261 RepID=UPI003850A29F
MAASAVAVFAAGILAGQTIEHANSSSAAFREPGREYRSAVPQCSLNITGGPFDTVSRGTPGWNEVMASVIDAGSEGFDCVPDADGIWTGTAPLRNPGIASVTYTLSALITDGNSPSAVASSDTVIVELRPGETRTMTLANFRYSSR